MKTPLCVGMVLTISLSAFAGGEGEAAASQGADSGEIATGNVIFLHPDGTGLNHWNAGRMYWYGTDGILNWDRMTEMNAYRGHMANRLTGASHGGATVHAFGDPLAFAIGRPGTNDVAGAIVAGTLSK